MKPGRAIDSARRFLALRKQPVVDLDAWTYDALYNIAYARAMPIETVLEEMLDTWEPTTADAARARKTPP